MINEKWSELILEESGIRTMVFSNVLGWQPSVYYLLKHADTKGLFINDSKQFLINFDTPPPTFVTLFNTKT